MARSKLHMGSPAFCSGVHKDNAMASILRRLLVPRSSLFESGRENLDLDCDAWRGLS